MFTVLMLRTCLGMGPGSLPADAHDANDAHVHGAHDAHVLEDEAREPPS